MQAGIAGVHPGLNIGDEGECERTRREYHVGGAHSPGVRFRIDHADGLIQKEKAEACQSDDAVVGRVALCALVVEIDDALGAQPRGK